MVHLLSESSYTSNSFENFDSSIDKVLNSDNFDQTQHPISVPVFNLSKNIKQSQIQNFNNKLPQLRDALEALRIGGVRNEINSLASSQPIVKNTPSFADRVLFITNQKNQNQ